MKQIEFFAVPITNPENGTEYNVIVYRDTSSINATVNYWLDDSSVTSFLQNEINKLVNSKKTIIKALSQPYNSFDGANHALANCGSLLEKEHLNFKYIISL